MWVWRLSSDLRLMDEHEQHEARSYDRSTQQAYHEKVQSVLLQVELRLSIGVLFVPDDLEQTLRCSSQCSYAMPGLDLTDRPSTKRDPQQFSSH